MRIAIIGLGGVGGYLGGALLKAGRDVAFVVRGENLAAIKEKGIAVKSSDLGEFIVKPRIATDNPAEIGPVDAVIVAVKGYSLEDAAKAIEPIVTDETLILPVLNGVGIGDKLRSYMTKGRVVDGCIYIASALEGPGKVYQFGQKPTVVMGAADKEQYIDKFDELEKFLTVDGIKVVSDGDVQLGIWTKYLFICSFAGVSTYYGVNAGQLREDPDKIEDFRGICREIIAIATKKGINLANEFEPTINRMLTVDPNTTSSLQRDCAVAGKPNEAEQFCAHVERMGLEMGVPTPVSTRIAAGIRERFS